MNEIIDELNVIKMKNCCYAKDNIKRMRRQATDQEEKFAKYTSDK